MSTATVPHVTRTRERAPEEQASSRLSRAALAILPPAAALGPFMPGLGPLFGFRVLVIIVSLAAILPAGKGHRRGQLSALPLIVIWLLVLTGTFFTAPDRLLATRMALAVLIGLGCILAVERLATDQSSLRALEIGWIAAFAIAGLLGARESLTGVHYSGYLSNVELARVDTRLVASVFGNPNAFAVFLLMSQPFLLVLAMTAASRVGRATATIALVGNFCLVLVTGSRLGLAATVLQILLFLLLNGGRRSLATLLAGVVLTVATARMGILDRFLPLLPAKVAPFVEVLLNGGSGLSQDASGVGRLNLYRDGVWLLRESWGLGLGPGALQWNLANSDLPFATGGVGSPHNGYLEIGVEFGLVTLCALLLWLVRSGRIFMASRGHDRSHRVRGTAMVSSLAGISFMCLANSSFLSSATTWMWLATIGGYAAVLGGGRVRERRKPGAER